MKNYYIGRQLVSHNAVFTHTVSKSGRYKPIFDKNQNPMESRNKNTDSRALWFKQIEKRIKIEADMTFLEQK